MIFKRLAFLAVFLGAVIIASAAYADDETPYVYEKTGFGTGGKLTMEAESAYGVRETRPFGQQGFELGAKLKYRFFDWFSMDAKGAAVFDDKEYKSSMFAAEALFGVLSQDKYHINLSLGAGYTYDFDGVSVPTLRLSLNRAFGALDLTLSGTAEFPIADDRDPFDVIVGLGTSYQFVSWFAGGVEAVGEDLEGLWDEEEAEGGAKFLIGPTLTFLPADNFFVKFNGAVSVSMTNNAARNGKRYDSPGFLGRLALGYSF